jgi:O-antigen ligase
VTIRPIVLPPARDNRRLPFAGASFCWAIASGFLLTLLLVGAGAATVFVASTAASTREFVALAVAITLGVIAFFLATAQFEWLVLGLLAARASLDAFHLGGGLDPGTAAGTAALVLGLAWLLPQWANSRLHPMSPISRGLVLLAAVALVSSAVATDRALAVPAAARIASGALMFVVIEQLCHFDDRFAGRILRVAGFSALVPVGVALYQWTHHQRGFADRSGFSRISGTFVHPDSFATYLGLILVVLIVGAMTDARHRKILVIAIVPATVVLFLTYSRGGWLAVAIGAIYLTWRRRKIILVPVAAVLAAIVISVPALGARFSDLSTHSTPSGAPANSFAWRTYYWKRTSRYFLEHPVAGVGLENVQRLELEGNEPHNLIVQTAAEMGLMGLFALTVVLAAVARMLVRARRLFGPRDATALLATGASLVLLIQGLLTNVLTEALLLWYWAALTAPAAAAVVAAERRFERARQGRPAGESA